jgi:DtxR family Mn-dependent transcriptional regulator
MTTSEILSASLEDYLEAIYHIVLDKQAARAKDIAQRLDVNNSSVTGALRSLSEKGFINYAPYDLITLTVKGKDHAEKVVRRHEALMDFFVNGLRIAPTEASGAAFHMKHALSDMIMERLFRIVELVKLCPQDRQDWIDEFWKNAEDSENTPVEICETSLGKALKYVRQVKKTIEDSAIKPVGVNTLDVNERGLLIKIKGRTTLNKRLEEAGIRKGSVVEVCYISPSQDSYMIKSRGYRITLSTDEASKIMLNSIGMNDAGE